MAEEPTANPMASQAGAGQANPAQAATSAGQAPNEQSQPNNQPNIDALPEWARNIIAELRTENANHRKAKTEAEKQVKTAEEERLKQQGEWQKLAEAAKAELEQVKAQNAELERQQLLTKVARKHNLPEELAARLVGATEDELEADAKKLAKLIPAQARPGNGPGPNPAGGNGPINKDEAKKNLLASGNYF